MLDVRNIHRFILFYLRLPNRPLLKGVLAVNDILTKAEKLLEGQIHGPECLLVEGGLIHYVTHVSYTRFCSRFYKFLLLVDSILSYYYIVFTISS